MTAPPEPRGTDACEAGLLERAALRERVFAGMRVELCPPMSGRAVAEAFGEAPVVLVLAAGPAALGWLERKPLFGKRVVITRAGEQAEDLAAILREAGAEPIAVPTIELHPPPDPAPLARAVRELQAGGYSWVMFTSANGVGRTWEALVSAGADARAFGATRLAAVGPATARALEQRGLRADVVAEQARGEGLAQAILTELGKGGLGSGTRGVRVLLPRAAVARDVLPDALRASGCVVDVVSAYETRPPARDTVLALASELEAGRVDVVTFLSSSAVTNLCDMLGARAVGLLGPLGVASIGPLTTATAQARGLRVDVTAPEPTGRALVQAVAERYTRGVP